MMNLTPREAFILSMRKFQSPPATYRWLGLVLGVSPERVEHVEKKLESRIRIYAGQTYPVKAEDIERVK